MTTELHTSRVGHTLVVTISALETGNALRPEMLAAAVEILSTVERDRTIRAVLIKGAGETFCSGWDLHHLAAIRTMDTSGQLDAIDGLQSLVESILGCTKPIIAAVEGDAAGAGLSLALACDLIVAGRSARFSAPNAGLGLTPDGGITWLLAQALPRQLASDMLLTGQPTDTHRLHALGVINRITDDGHAFDAAISIADEIANHAPEILVSAKSALGEARQASLAQHFESEKLAFIESLRSRHAQEGINAFLAKRKPVFK